jgi:predicted phage terminase large subunit-like protein
VGRHKETGTHPPVVAEATSTDKVVRVNEFAHLIENGTLKFKLGNPRVAALVDHLVNFDGKGSDIDDDVDALGFALKGAVSGATLFSSTEDFDVIAKGR